MGKRGALAPTGHAGGPISTIIADDDPGFRRLLGLFLARLPEVELVGTAGNGREALELVASLQPQLVLMDIGMAGINGLEAAALVRELHPGTRVIILTMNDAEEVKAACLERGVDGFVSKSHFQTELPGMIKAGTPGTLPAHKATERLRLRNIALSRVLEQNPVSIVITDLSGQIEYVNPAFCKTTGYHGWLMKTPRREILWN
jgi:CheY-like chemotaxis protein